MTDETYNEILWLESLRDSIEDGETQNAIEAIEAAIELKRRNAEQLKS